MFPQLSSYKGGVGSREVEINLTLSISYTEVHGTGQWWGAGQIDVQLYPKMTTRSPEYSRNWSREGRHTAQQS